MKYCLKNLILILSPFWGVLLFYLPLSFCKADLLEHIAGHAGEDSIHSVLPDQNLTLWNKTLCSQKAVIQVIEPQISGHLFSHAPKLWALGGLFPRATLT